MAGIELEKLNYKNQRRLFRVNLFYYIAVAIFLFLNWYDCNFRVENFNSLIKSFKSGEKLTCKERFVSKKRGWSIDKLNRKFIKADTFMDIRDCKMKDNYEK